MGGCGRLREAMEGCGWLWRLQWGALDRNGSLEEAMPPRDLKKYIYIEIYVMMKSLLNCSFFVFIIYVQCVFITE